MFFYAIQNSEMWKKILTKEPYEIIIGKRQKNRDKNTCTSTYCEKIFYCIMKNEDVYIDIVSDLSRVTSIYLIRWILSLLKCNWNPLVLSNRILTNFA